MRFRGAKMWKKASPRRATGHRRHPSGVRTAFRPGARAIGFALYLDELDRLAEEEAAGEEGK